MSNNNIQNNPCLTCHGSNCCVDPIEVFPLDYMPYKLARDGKMIVNDKKQCIALVNGKCSIYEDRPIVCRKYKCEKFFKGTNNGCIT
jgi:Fe-S-cluster containining protein